MGQLRIKIDIADEEFREALIAAFSLLGGVDTTGYNPHIILSDFDGDKDREKTLKRVGKERYSDKIRLVYPAMDENEESLDEEPYFINLYDDIYIIKSKLDYILGRNFSSNNIRKRKIALILFLSDQGGAGSTTLALSSAIALRRMYGGKALYLSLHPFNYQIQAMLRGQVEIGLQHGFMTWMYGLKKGKMPSLGMIVAGGDEVDLIDVPLFNKDWSFFKSDYINSLLDIADKEGYKWLIVDAGNAVNTETLKLAAISDEVIFVTRDGHEALDLDIALYERVANGVEEDFDEELQEENADIHIIPFSTCIGGGALETEYGTELESMLYKLGGLNAKMRLR